MKVLVLGGNGFIGSHVVDSLLTAGHSVRVLDQSPERYRPPLVDVDYRTGQFEDARALEGALADIDTVVHLVSTTVPSTSNENPRADVEGNLIPTLALLDMMMRQRVNRIVFFSSGGTVYGDTEEPLVAETAPVHPICSHAIVKLAIEKYLHMYNKLYGMEYIALRVANPYGEGQGHLGVQGVIGTFMNRLHGGHSLEIWGDGSVERDYIYVADVARACQLAVDSDAHGIFNIGSGTGVSLNEIVSKLEEVTGISLTPRYEQGRAYDVRRIVLDCRKARDVLGWRPEIEIDEGLAKSWRWLSSL